MPIYNIGYRKWAGNLINKHLYFLAITYKGVTLALRQKWIQRVIIWSLIPSVYSAFLFFVVSKATDPAWTSWVSTFIGRYAENILTNLNPKQIRINLWSLVFYKYMQGIQIWITLFLITFIGARLIADDLKGKAFLLYFSKPITIFQYLMGKFLILMFFSCLVNLLPNLISYLVSIVFSPSIEVLFHTWIIVAKVIVGYLIVVVPYALLMLFFSSLTTSSRIAGFIGFVFLIFGDIFYQTLSMSLSSNRSYIISNEGFASPANIASWPLIFSIKANIQNVVYYLFNIDDVWNIFQKYLSRGWIEYLGIKPMHPLWISIVYLVTISLFSFKMLHKKVRGQIRI